MSSKNDLRPSTMQLDVVDLSLIASKYWENNQHKVDG